jgi:hypothetical protein
MDGRQFTLIACLIVPAILIGVTIAAFASNPLSIFGLISVMVVGSLYLLTYRETYG